MHRGSAAIGRAAVTIGSFDGIHLGHQHLIQALRQVAEAERAASVMVTFDPHPRCVLAPDRCPELLTTLDEKAALLDALGVGHLVVIPFDRAFSERSPAEFMAWLGDRMEVAAVVTGYDFFFGHKRSGDARWLEAHGYRVVEVAPVKIGEQAVHTTGIRGLVGSGEVAAAAELLGRPYSVRGEVVEGHKRGRELGFPTANTSVPKPKLVPGTAAYAGWARVDGIERMAAISVGHQPTFGGGDLAVEAHLLDFDGDLYGKVAEILFVERLHPDTRYPSVEALIEQIGRDVDETRRILSAT
jgi:riboflavin kinase/FMN adenylyltransferase